MRKLILMTTALLLLPVIASAATFTIDEIIPGEGHEGDCYLRLWRENAKAVDDSGPPSILENSGDGAYFKIDGKVSYLSSIKHAYKDKEIYELYVDTRRGIQVEQKITITRKDLHPDGDTLHLKGTLRVDYKGQSQVLEVGGEDICYSG
ncbi:hypothetical protein ABI_25740 [Asticcacaulis biprosthecium C19]|uniref:Uncharacterized protein n=1 Tax=Asticcacaulis biprosthecium C19 TaxID=715226 RepID=F4QPA2_9CAUL|nr:hypothetical protein [Asticcacaulis biprosthecium]EGF91160.1 hypothetical protein ABI_25740 [Asticcacaulis biprosthecium C19]